MTSSPESRLDRIESALERLINIQASVLTTQEQHEERVARSERLLEQQQEVLRELQAGAARQDRILDYLMRRDGER